MFNARLGSQPKRAIPTAPAAVSLSGLYGADMKKMTYAEQLKSPMWQRKRLEILDLNDFSCENCGDSEATLHVHHKLYIKGRMAWDYNSDQLASLCEACHQSEHAFRSDLDELVAHVGSETAAALLRGFITGTEYSSVDPMLGDGARVSNPNVWFSGVVAGLSAYLSKKQAASIAESVMPSTKRQEDELRAVRFIVEAYKMEPDC